MQNISFIINYGRQLRFSVAYVMMKCGICDCVPGRASLIRAVWYSSHFVFCVSEVLTRHKYFVLHPSEFAFILLPLN